MGISDMIISESKDNMATFYPVSSEANAHLVQIDSKVFDRLSKSLPPHQRDLFLLRLQRHFQDLYDGLFTVYGQRNDFADFLERLVLLMADQYVACPEMLKQHQVESMIWPDWFQHESMIGYITYADRFADGLKGIESHIDYLSELGVTYLHLMPFLKPRAGENDGGYAVANYREVDPRIGDIAALESLTSRLREKGIRLVADLVINHVADDHDWAIHARNGEQRYLDYFISSRIVPYPTNTNALCPRYSLLPLPAISLSCQTWAVGFGQPSTTINGKSIGRIRRYFSNTPTLFSF